MSIFGKISGYIGRAIGNFHSLVYRYGPQPKFLFYTSLAAFLAVISLFAFNRTRFDLNDRIDNEAFGTIGDFFGGVIGTFFALVSVLWMSRAFEQQRDEAQESRKQVEENHKQLEVQRFNDMFFELLHLYQTIVSDLSGSARRISKATSDTSTSTPASVEVSYDNKDFFDIEKVILQQNFMATGSLRRKRNAALGEYLKFYVSEPKVGAYFRTLYRIFESIDRQAHKIRSTPNQAIMRRKDIRDYVKIIRAQLTEGELFFLRYNATTLYGSKFAPLLNRYNVLKHLSPFELLEFKDWRDRLDDLEKAYVNLHFSILKKFILRLLRDGGGEEKFHKGLGAVKYDIRVNVPNPSEVIVTMVIDRTFTFTKEEFKPFDKFSSDELKDVVNNFLQEIFIFSHFEKPRYSEYDITGDVLTSQDGNKDTVTCSLKWKGDRPLLDKFPHITYWHQEE